MPKYHTAHDTLRTKNQLHVVGHCPISHKRQFAALEPATSEAKRLSDESGYVILPYQAVCCPYYHVGKQRCPRCSGYLKLAGHVCPNPDMTVPPRGFDLADLPAIDSEYAALGAQLTALSRDLAQIRQGILDPALRAGQPVAVYRAMAIAECERIKDRRRELQPIRHRLHQFRDYQAKVARISTWSADPPDLADTRDLLMQIRTYFAIREIEGDLTPVEQALRTAISRWLVANQPPDPLEAADEAP